MIIFDLACKQEHAFEGWFQSQAAYDSQVEKGFVLCPQCGSNEIRRVPSALHISRPSSSSVADSETLAPQSSLAAYQQIMSLITKIRSMNPSEIAGLICWALGYWQKEGTPREVSIRQYSEDLEQIYCQAQDDAKP